MQDIVVDYFHLRRHARHAISIYYINDDSIKLATVDHGAAGTSGIFQQQFPPLPAGVSRKSEVPKKKKGKRKLINKYGNAALLPEAGSSSGRG